MSDEKREPTEPAAGARESEPPLDELDDEARAVLDEARASNRDDEERASNRDDEDAEGLDEVDVRELLRSALAPPKGAVAPELLQGVQRRIRTRSRGKFYGDGWSTAKSPRSTYLVTSLLMLVLIGFVFFVLVPWGGGALPT
ncbi:MAG: hypothetical protein ABI134_15490, partial [Byssovorax sp.]